MSREAKKREERTELYQNNFKRANPDNLLRTLISAPPPAQSNACLLPARSPIGQETSFDSLSARHWTGGRGAPIPLGGVYSGGVLWLRLPLHLNWSRAAAWPLPELRLLHTRRPSAHAPSHSSHSPKRAANPAIGQVEEATAGEGNAVWSAIMSVALAVVQK